MAALLLAGGMGTRLGSDKPKGMYNIGETKDVYIFEDLQYYKGYFIQKFLNNNGFWGEVVRQLYYVCYGFLFYFILQ